MRPSGQNQQQSVITSQQFGAKFQTKYSVHQFLTVECSAYLPPNSCVTIYHMKDLMMGKKKCKHYHSQIFTHSYYKFIVINSNNIKHLAVPYYEGLNVEGFISHFDKVPQVKDYFPDKKDELKRLPRQFIINVMHTICGPPFEKWCKEV